MAIRAPDGANNLDLESHSHILITFSSEIVEDNMKINSTSKVTL